MASVTFQPFSWERLARAVDKVRERLLRATAALEGAGIPYAVVGGNAVAAWVIQVDEAAVRNTQDVDILLRQEDLEAAKVALAKSGFVYCHVKSIDMFLDGPGSKARDAVHILFAGKKVKQDDLLPAPDVSDIVQSPGMDFRHVSLEGLVRMKLTAFRRKDQVHLQDMIDVGLIDSTWPARFPPQLAERLQIILDTPEG